MNNKTCLAVKSPLYEDDFISFFGRHKLEYLKAYGRLDPLVDNLSDWKLITNVFNLFDEFHTDRKRFLDKLAKLCGSERVVLYEFFDNDVERCRNLWLESTPQERLQVDKGGYVLLTHVCEAKDLASIERLGLIPLSCQGRPSQWENGNRANNSINVVYLANNFTNCNMSQYGQYRLTVRVKASDISYSPMAVTDSNLFKYDEYTINEVSPRQIVNIEYEYKELERGSI